uniref:C1 cytochrome ABC transporter subunit n=1 Tax=Cyanidiococcus yangmingshanensis TaxID=2690220 RepID=A0A7H0WBE6_9RHOD|nr:c1 cytochrome ABC transporter subunit [Cyanidiococcus yangmingshanensis]UNJ18927.1 c1 cytochrome ABC transporter subunit [Cyanidioschyzonaceae sp. 2 FvB-2021]
MNIFVWLLKPNNIFKYTSNLLNYVFNIFCFSLIINLLYLYILNFIDYKQGFYAQIIFVHIPAAWISIFTYILLGISCFLFLLYKHPLLIYINDVFSFLSLLFVIITLITGSLWGKSTWGTWWVWDARLTSVFVMFIILLSILILRIVINDSYISIKLISFLGLLGMINIPVVKFSVQWWNTLHQPSSITLFQSSIDYSLLISIYGIFFVFLFFSFWVFISYMRVVILELKYS